ncbi:MAG: zinc-dependent peptidase [Bacteroidota bacterium]
MQIVRASDLVFRLLIGGLLGLVVGVVGVVAMGAVGAVWALGPMLVVVALAGRTPWRRWRLAQQKMPASYRTWLETHVSLYARLDDAGQARFERDVRFALAERRFEGVDGVEVTDDLRLGVAAGIALLLHGRPDWELSDGRTFLFLPTYFGDHTDEIYSEEDYGTADYDYDGMVHAQGPVLLAAPSVRDGWARPDGQNVVLHELAHLFDFDDTDADGLPSLLDPGSRDAWITLMHREMRAAERGRSMLGRYASTAPAELFAVATEVFFERPVVFSQRHPELFDALAAFYALDPRSPGWEATANSPPERQSRMARRWGSQGTA